MAIMHDRSVKTNLFTPLETMSSTQVGAPQKEESEYCCPPLTFWVSHIEVRAMYGGLLFVKESDFVSFISILRREGQQLQDTDKMNSLKEE